MERRGTWTNAVSLDGVNDYVDLGYLVLLQFTGSMTVSAWIFATGNPADDAAIVSKRSSRPNFELDTTVDTGLRTVGFKLTNSSGGQMLRRDNLATQHGTTSQAYITRPPKPWMFTLTVNSIMGPCRAQLQESSTISQGT